MNQNKLELESISIIKEAVARFKNPVLLWSGGKDSTTLLTLARKTFASLDKLQTAESHRPKPWGRGKFPLTVMQIDTSYDFKETYEYLDKYAQEWHLPFLRYQNVVAIKKGINPFEYDHLTCCHQLKTEALAKAIREYRFDAVLTALRKDEHPARKKESFFSPRKNPNHIRVHPLLNWSEKDVWAYLRKNKIPYHPLYDRVEPGNLVYRSLGCYPCTQPVAKDQIKERAGRAKDKEKIMEDLRALGYM